MDFVFCNKCLVVPSAQQAAFFFTNCMHIYCKDCVGRLHVPLTPRITCAHCKKEAQICPIGPKMPDKVKKLFTPPEKMVAEQKKKTAMLIKCRADEIKSMKEFAKKDKEMLGRAMKAGQAASEKVKALTNANAELQQVLEQHQRQSAATQHQIRLMQLQMSGGGGVAAAGRRTPAMGGYCGGGTSMMNLTSQSDPATMSMDESMRSMHSNSSFTDFLGTGGRVSAPSTPLFSQMSSISEITTPKILGLPKNAGAGASGGVRSDNPYMAMWNRASVERQKKAAAVGGGGGGGGYRNRSMESNESILIGGTSSSAFSINGLGRKH